MHNWQYSGLVLKQTINNFKNINLFTFLGTTESLARSGFQNYLNDRSGAR